SVALHAAVLSIVVAPPAAVRAVRSSLTQADLRADAGLVGDHLFQALEIRHERRLVHNADLADDRHALGKDARVVGAHDIRAHAHQLRETLRYQSEVAALHARAERVQDDDARAAARRRNHLTAGAFEGHER